MKIWVGDNLISKDVIHILGLEASCDDTSVAVMRSDSVVLSNIVHSHCAHVAEYGGVVPELAARAHVDSFPQVLSEALAEAKVTLDTIDLIGFTRGPGLIGGLIASTVFGKTLASVMRIPMVGVNHLEGHLLSAMIEHNLEFPYIALLITGGHSQIIEVSGIDDYKVFGGTVDDAVGELFDKVARILGIGTNGATVEAYAKGGCASNVKLPRPMIREPGCNFSCSGLKTAVKRLAESTKSDEQNTRDICASFQESIVDVLIAKLRNASLLSKAKQMAIVGGVAANKYIIESIRQSFPDHEIYVPSMKLCSDNAAMIAFAAYKRLQRGYYSNIGTVPDPALDLSISYCE